MYYEDILKSEYYSKTYNKIEKMKKDFPVNHGFVHINNVIKNAKRLAVFFELDEREERLLLIACTLHDIGYLKGRENHAFNGSVLAREYLENQGFSEDDIGVVCRAINNHGGKEEKDFLETVSMCLAIADKLDFVSSRYKKELLDGDKLQIFPNILDAFLEKESNSLILKIVVNSSFSVSLFQLSGYYNKLTVFLELLSKKLGCSCKIKYGIQN